MVRTTLTKTFSLLIFVFSRFIKLKLRRINKKEKIETKNVFDLPSIKRLTGKIINKIVKKDNPKIPTNFTTWMNSLLNAQICPVRFKGRPPNSFDRKISE